MSYKYTEQGVNTKNNDILFYKKDIKAHKLDEKALVIHSFTSNDNISRILYHAKGYKLVRIDSKKQKIIYQDEEIEFSTISDVLEGDEENITKYKKELLNLRQRTRKCHNMSLSFLGSDIGDRVVTGYIDSTSKNTRVIHSWLETEDKVIDYTCNLIIDKDQYYKLWNPEVLSVISREDFKADYEKEFMHILGCKFYCLFRDELYKEGLIENSTRTK